MKLLTRFWLTFLVLIIGKPTMEYHTSDIVCNKIGEGKSLKMGLFLD